MFCTLLVASALLPAFQSRKVNDPLRRAPDGGDVQSLIVSPDGAWVAYLAEPNGDGRLELFSRPLDGSAPQRNLSRDPDVFIRGPVEISAGAQRAVYVAIIGPGAKDELLSVPIDGSAGPRKLNGTLPSGGDVSAFVISPNGSRVLYLADQSADGLMELWSVPTNRSSAPLRINPTLVTGGDVSPGFRVAGERAFYLADQDTDGVVELYSAPVAGGAPPVKLNPPLPAGRGVQDFRTSPDGQRVVYRADQVVNDRFELYSVPATGGTPVKLNGPLVAGGDVTSAYEIDPLSTRVAYLADQLTDVMVEVFSAPIDGSATSVRLNPPLIAQGDVWSLGIAPGGQRMAYLADAEVDETVELYSVGLDGRKPVKLNLPLPPGGNVGNAGIGLPLGVLFSGDGARAVYWADQEVDEVIELYSVPMSGAAPPLELSGQLATGGDVSTADLRISADGLHVLFRADKVADELFELWSAPIDGGASREREPVRLCGALPAPADVLAFGLGNDPTDPRVAFLADAEFDEQVAVWSVPLDGDMPPLQLNDPLLMPAVLGDVAEYSWSPDGGRVLYVAGQEGDAGLFSKRTGSLAPAQLLHSPAPGRQFANQWLFDPGSERVVLLSGRYTQYPNEDLDDDVLSVPRDGSLAPVEIGDDSDDGFVLEWIALDGGRLIYLQVRTCCSGPPPSRLIWNAAVDGSQPPLELVVATGASLFRMHVTPQQDLLLYSVLEAGTYTLRAVPVDGSAPPVVITPPLARMGGSCYPDFQLTLAGDLALFVGAFAAGDPDELWSVPVAGGAPVRVSAALLPGRTVHPVFLLTPDGTRVVYRADQDSDEVYELYSAPTLGGASVKLSGTMVAGGDVADPSCSFDPFVLSPDGARVFYRADQVTDEVYQIFSAPVSGSAPAVRLEPSFTQQYQFSRWISFAQNGQRVVYVAQKNASPPFPRAVYSAPADGSAPALEITPLLVGSVQDFALTPDEASVVYRADQRASQRYELFSVPLDGSRVSTRLNGPLVTGGDVWNFQIGSNGDVLYLADEEHDNVLELFLTLGPKRTPRVR